MMIVREKKAVDEESIEESDKKEKLLRNTTDNRNLIDTSLAAPCTRCVTSNVCHILRKYGDTQRPHRQRGSVSNTQNYIYK